ncbi:MAG: hypothetical protein J7L21_00915 [Sulfurimonas sp.]|nr:hypothetical protein [Sulfurimonas sp.]
MKFLAWIGGILLTIVVGIYVVAFTSFGNGIIKPIIETKIKEQTKLDSELTSFSLSMSEFNIVLLLDKDNSLFVNGTYSLFSQAFDITYRVEMNKLQALKSLTNAPIQGKFYTNGTVKGDMAFIEIDGVSDVAKSETTYHVELTELNPTSIIAKIKEAKLDSLLYLGGQSSYAKADINLDINFKNITPHALDGDVSLVTKKGKIDSFLMKNDFNVSIPNTSFDMKLDAKLKGDGVDYTYLLSSNLAKIISSGKVIPQPLKTDIKYAVDIKELAVLKPITGADVRGAFRLNGSVKGTKAKMIVDGKSDIASSDTKFTATLKEFNPATIKATIKDLKLQKVLYMVKQPHYTDGVLSLSVDISDAKSGKLKGTIVSKIQKGLLDSKFITKEYKFKTPMPRTTYKLSTLTTLSGDIADTKVDLDSSLANLDIKRARFNIKDGSLVSDYLVKIQSLDKLFFVSERHIRGGISANGELKKAKDLDFTMHSNVVGGKIDALLHNDDFHADLTSVQTLDALRMLIYPEIFKSSLNAKVDYNLVQKKGTFSGHLVDGKFTKNQVLTLVKQYAQVDLYAEKFKGDIGATINKEKIIASLDLRSNTSSIKTKNTKLNSKTKKISSKIDIVANHNPLTVKLSGDVSSPKVEVDATELMKKEAGKAIDKEVGKLLRGLF